MAKILSYVGFVALITVFFFSGGFLRRFGWRFSAQITPICLGVGGIIFFFLVIGQNHIAPIASVFGVNPVKFLVIFGGCQFILGKVVKYSFFDSTKEMAFIPLDQESKVKGKAAIDLVGSRLGKSGSAFLQVGLIDLIGSGSILSIIPYLLPVFVIVILGWSTSVNNLSREFSASEKKSTPVPVPVPAE